MEDGLTAWYAFGSDAGTTGPADNKLGGAQVGDHTIQPENGGLGVYAHECSWLGTGKEAIGDLPGDMNAWDKLQLGWLDYDVAKAGTKSAHTLGAAEYNAKHQQALVVPLPDGWGYPLSGRDGAVLRQRRGGGPELDGDRLLPVRVVRQDRQGRPLQLRLLHDPSGLGGALPVPERPVDLRDRVRSYDSPFSLYPTDGLTLHDADVATKIKWSFGVPVFNDHTSTYYDPSNPTGGVKIADTNTKIKIVREGLDGRTISLQVGPAVKWPT